MLSCLSNSIERNIMSDSTNSRWPNDADGDVLRRMVASGFDFSNETEIDFNIDFDSWPPPIELLEALRKQFAKVEMYSPRQTGSGYVLVVVQDRLTYDLVMFMQRSLTELAASSGGICESWGVLH